MNHGCWLRKRAWEEQLYCSVCKGVALGKMETWAVAEGSSTSYTYVKSKYCPHCGATMDAVVNNGSRIDLDLDKNMEFDVVGDVLQVIRSVLGEYVVETPYNGYSAQLKGAPGIRVAFPYGSCPKMFYCSNLAKPKCRWIIAQLYEEGLIELKRTEDDD